MIIPQHVNLPQPAYFCLPSFEIVFPQLYSSLFCGIFHRWYHFHSRSNPILVPQRITIKWNND